MIACELPLVIRPLRPIVPEGRADPDAWPCARRVLLLTLGGGAEEFAGWLAELYWRACSNAWPAGGCAPAAYRSLTRCCFTLDGGNPGPVLELVFRVLALGPARRLPESGEAVILTGRAPKTLRFMVRGTATRAESGAATAEAPRFARWLYETGLERALAAETADAGYRVRRLVKRTCEGVDIEEEA